jgi:hypothetical protein
MLDLNSPNINQQKVLQSLQRNSNNYGKLKMLFRQMTFIKQEIESLVNESLETSELEKVSCKFAKVPGNHYYLYQKIESEEFFFSMLEPEVWKYEKTNIFIGKYLFDYDLTFQKVI